LSYPPQGNLAPDIETAEIQNNAVTDAKIASHTSTKITITSKPQLNSAIVFNDQTNVFGDFNQDFKDDKLRIFNPADTFAYNFVGAAIVAARTITLPLLTGNDILVTEAFAQTFTNKTFDLTDNTLTGSSGELAIAISGSTGSGSLVFGTAPVLASPVVTTLLDIGTSTLQFSEANQDIIGSASGLVYDVPTGDTHDFDVNGAVKFRFSETIFTIVDGNDVTLGGTTGTKIATATSQKIGFWNATPVVQQAHIVDADGTLADITTKFNTLLAQMATTGMQAAS